MVDQPEAELFRDRLLQPLDFLVAEFDHLAGAQVDQMVVVFVGDGLVAASPGAEIVAGDDPGILEQLDRPVDGGDRDFRIDRRGPAIEFLDVRMVESPIRARGR